MITPTGKKSQWKVVVTEEKITKKNEKLDSLMTINNSEMKTATWVLGKKWSPMPESKLQVIIEENSLN